RRGARSACRASSWPHATLLADFMGLGRTTRFASAPPGSRRVSGMGAGAAGVKALSPPVDLFEAFRREKAALTKEGLTADRAHAEAFRRTHYRERFLSHVRSSPSSMQA